MAATTHSETTAHLTFHFEEGEDGWVTARIEEEPAAISQGRTRQEAYENVLDALYDLRHEASPVERFVAATGLRVRDKVAAIRARVPHSR
jgi:uncharacterized protein YdaU (DUF1376 family)